jgi:radical SAM superfamily enzyme
VKIVCDQLEVLPPECVIERVTGDGARDTLLAPLWSLKKTVVINEIDKELFRRNSYQGRCYNEN